MLYPRRAFAVIIMLALFIAPTFPLYAQHAAVLTPVASPNESLSMDAKAYAEAMDVSIDEAIRRLQLQDDIGELNRVLTEKEGHTFAGLWIQHQPEYRVITMFTKNGAATLQPYLQNGSLASLVQVQTAEATLQELETARARAVESVNQLGIRFSSAINIPKNRAELYVLDASQLTMNLLQTYTQLPANVDIVQFAELPKNVADIFGGKALSSCTSGFSVKNSSGRKGVTTAGHCSDTQWYNGVELQYMGGTPGGVDDIQWNRADQSFTVRNLIWEGTYNRYIFNVKFRSSQSVGEWVCKYGKTTGYACGTITTTSQDGLNVRVDNMTVQGGDSGGPWFWNNTAYGTTISACTLYSGTPCAIYGPVDHIYNTLGVSVLTN